MAVARPSVGLMSRPLLTRGLLSRTCPRDEQLLIEMLNCSTFRVNYLLRQWE